MDSKADDSIPAERRRRTHRNLRLIRLFVLVATAGAFTGMAAGVSRGWPASIMDGLFASLAIVLFGATGAIHLVRCPRCGKGFVNALIRSSDVWLSYSCQHCGLEV